MLSGARRTDYDGPPLGPEHVDPDPLVQLAAWLDEARDAGVVEPEAMALATVGPDGAPACRYVLLRGIDARGLAFFTNHASAKARALAGEPRCALTFGWLAMYRSARVEGTAARLPDTDADAYFATRPRGSTIGAWASPQSEVIADRAALEARVSEIEQRFAGTDPVPRPPFWGGYVVAPRRVELWQGRRSRLHDRVRYERDADGWRIERLAP